MTGSHDRLISPESGAAMGYRALILDASAPPVWGDVLESPGLRGFWEVLDEFEGTGYKRVSRCPCGSTTGPAWTPSRTC